MPAGSKWSSFRAPRRAAALVAVLAASAVSAWLTPGCRSGSEPRTQPPDESTLRMYVVGSVAGALEPCGCVKDMLGGVDHAAAFLRGDAASRPQSLIVGAGPMLFLNRTLPAVGAEQHRFKAQAIAESFRDLGLSAWAPGANDWAAGPAELQRLERVSGATLLGGSRPVRVVDVKGQRVGLAGVTRSEPGRNPPAEDPAVALSRAKAELGRAGARILVALVALPRGDALRAIERAPGFDLAVVGKAHDEGEANDAAIPPVMIGETLVVQPPNHLQALSVVDFHVRGDSYDFKDGFGIQEAERRARLSQRIRELDQRLAEWGKPDSGAGAPDVAARRTELSQMKQELAGIIGPPSRPDGSFFSYQLVEIREGLGSDPQVHARMNDYYRRVNEHNRQAFKDRVPPPVPQGEKSYVGGAACAACHEEEDKFWSTTPHASAYETLAKDHKEFNLECVGCHVTGYERPGGSTVTHVSRLKDVGCEVCHGPGSRHAAEPARRDRIVRSPPRSLCASECHHPPHVKEDWSVERAWAGILGPGHGAP